MAQQAIFKARNLIGVYGKGLLVSALIALTAQFLAEHCGAPAMLMALLLGIALHFLVAEPGNVCVAGGELASRTVLRIGVALLGRGWRFGTLTGGSVAICGVSAEE
ncbi:putative sulfate exporter family transporter [Leisingera sp. ANG-Vp]|uniref:putative sulfate exporter family transporter n=1 Tax=Leisingera sp. ANG-Vp TaxID=1577896 RepID=UPI00068DECD8